MLMVVVTAGLALGMVEPPTAVERFEQLKSLAGTWVGDTDGDGTDDYEAVYHVIAAGSAVHQTMFPGTAHEMVNVYHLDGDDLLMTHYCAGGNQPHLKMTPVADRGRLEFEWVSVSNLPSLDGHFMGAATIELVDENTIREHWSSFENREKVSTMNWEITRKEAMSEMKPPEGMPDFVEYTIVLLRPVEGRPDLPEQEAEAIQQQHLAHLDAMREHGMVFAGPFGDRTGGMCIYHGPSVEKVRELAEADPAVKAGRLDVHAHPWLVPGGLASDK